MLPSLQSPNLPSIPANMGREEVLLPTHEVWGEQALRVLPVWFRQPHSQELQVGMSGPALLRVWEH
jgi:hypothetical protein